MKIGIVTWFTYENYGTKLQAIALQKYLREKGFDAILMNFTPPEMTEDNDNSEKRLLKKGMELHNINIVFRKVYGRIYRYANLIAQKKYRKELCVKSARLNDIINNICVLSDKIITKEDYVKVCSQMDCLIFGSDQIWNPNWLHPFYYAHFEEIRTKKIAYAPSIGVNQIEIKRQKEYKEILKHFSTIGIREKTGQQIIQELYVGKVEQVVDPTLLHTKEEWNKILNIPLNEKGSTEKYIVVYFLGDNPKHWEATYNLAKREKLKIKIIPCVGLEYLKRGEIVADAGVEEFVKLIQDAIYVVTDSFHATVFSVIYNRNFYVFERFDPKDAKSQNSRIIDFLSDIDLEKQIIPFNSTIIKDDGRIDYSMVNKKLAVLIETSKDFLSKSIGNE